MTSPGTGLALVLLDGRPLAAQCPDGTPPPCARRAARAAVAAPAATSVGVLYFATRDSADAHAQRVVHAFAGGEVLPAHDAPLVVPALAAVGWREEALRLLEAAEPRGGLLWFYGRLQSFDRIRAAPRFQRVMADARPPGAPLP